MDKSDGYATAQRFVPGLPVYHPKMEHTAAAIRERMARDACSIRAFIDYNEQVRHPPSAGTDASALKCTHVCANAVQCHWHPGDVWRRLRGCTHFWPRYKARPHY